MLSFESTSESTSRVRSARALPLFLEVSEREERASELTRLLFVRVGPFMRGDRGSLEARVTQALDATFRRRELQAPSWEGRPTTWMHAATRVVASGGFEGLVLSFESLKPICNHRSALDGEDSRLLRELFALRSKRLIEMVLEPDDRDLEVFGPTVSLSALAPRETMMLSSFPPSLRVMDGVDAARNDASVVPANQNVSDVIVETPTSGLRSALRMLPMPAEANAYQAEHADTSIVSVHNADVSASGHAEDVAHAQQEPSQSDLLDATLLASIAGDPNTFSDLDAPCTIAEPAIAQAMVAVDAKNGMIAEVYGVAEPAASPTEAISDGSAVQEVVRETSPQETLQDAVVNTPNKSNAGATSMASDRQWISKDFFRADDGMLEAAVNQTDAQVSRRVRPRRKDDEPALWANPKNANINDAGAAHAEALLAAAVSATPKPANAAIREASEGQVVGAWADAAKAAAQVTRSREEAPSQAEVRTWTRILDGLTGPQSLGALEKAFTSAYMPLLSAFRQGLKDTKAKAACEKFGAGFAHVYREASRAFSIRQKLPPLVLDAPEIAMRLAREARAPKIFCVLCDSMRYDVGAAFARAFATRFPNVANVHSGILWAGLPTTTSRQIELLARGKEALLEEHVPQSEPTIGRDRTADAVRRARVGSREIYKLDSVAMRVLRGNVDAQDLGEAVADAIGGFVDSKRREQPHLLFVFGDHGYALRGEVPTEGSSLPEQVLVPSFGYVLPASS
jgi:hypothetical protein